MASVPWHPARWFQSFQGEDACLAVAGMPLRFTLHEASHISALTVIFLLGKNLCLVTVLRSIQGLINPSFGWRILRWSPLKNQHISNEICYRSIAFP